MSLSPEQKQTVASWVAAGDSLSVVQKKLQDELQVSMTYMDVRFLVDDLDLTLKDPEPQADASDVSKTPPPPTPPHAAADGSGADSGTAAADEFADGEIAEDDAAPPDAAAGNVSVSVDSVTLLPGAVASGTVRFSDGVTGKWVIDNYGRPGFTEISQPGYQPSPADAQAFMQELSRSLQ
ncbi:hypothetical protein AXK11_06530 [Cephaloticoccus primus]|uniref:Uncharacterized protein n=1 Tax=Cephaloticoccus primus TaxID=1548207 RepID=A0A139SLQ9_9BACT|nr:hypothetical protein [Cephaloticoccus primus]KXU35430.1 hypothetical protein AXK11_06530 [Cephaloticoccus primus]